MAKRTLAFLIAWFTPAVAFAGGGGAGEFWDDPTFTPAWVCLALLCALLVYGGGKVIGPFLSSRRKSIEDQLEEAKVLKAEAERVHQEYSARLEKLDAEFESLKADMIEAGEQEKQRIIEAAEAKGAAIRKDTQFIIDQQMKQLRLEVRQEAVRAAVESARSLLSEKINADDQARLAEDFLQRLTAGEGGDAKSANAAPQPRGTV